MFGCSVYESHPVPKNLKQEINNLYKRYPPPDGFVSIDEPEAITKSDRGTYGGWYCSSMNSKDLISYYKKMLANDGWTMREDHSFNISTGNETKYVTFGKEGFEIALEFVNDEITPDEKKGPTASIGDLSLIPTDIDMISAQETSEDLRYSIGKFDKSFEPTPELRREFIKIIADLPSNVAKAVEGLSDEHLDTPYRPEGWTVRQTVHHIADSHMNAFVRFRLALTEDLPTIRPYYEDLWAELADSKLPVDVSLKLVDGLHTRWTTMLNSMSDADFQKKLNHPESGEWTLDKMLGMYAWHSRHHTAHITNLRERLGW